MGNSFIPKQGASLALIDARASDEIIENLKGLGLRPIKTIACPGLGEDISYHPDIVIHPLDGKNIVVAPNVYDYYRELLQGLGFNIIRGRTYLGPKYPDHIAYNVARIGNHALHKSKYMEEEISSYFKQAKIDIIDVNQGYTKCSLGLIGPEEAITSDQGIYRSLLGLGYQVLLIEPGHIVLPGQAYGFIGGCLGNLNQDIVLISGSLDKHPDKARIEDFLRERKKTPIYLSREDIVDVGTIIVL